MEQSKLAEALAKAQGKIKAPKKTRKVNFVDNKGRPVKYNYADLADVIECVREPLSENGLAILHQMEYGPSGYGLTTTLLHLSGESKSTWYPLPDPMTADIRAQEFGSALTYARRYSLSALVGIASEEDDDGAQAAPTEPPKVTPKRAPAAPAPVKPKAPEASFNDFDQRPPEDLPPPEPPKFQVTKLMIDGLRTRCDSSGVGRGIVLEWLGPRKWDVVTEKEWLEVNRLVDATIEESMRGK